MIRLLHLSDLHFGRIDGGAVAALAHVIEELRPAAVIVTGDLTQAGRKREFIEAARFLKASPRPMLVVPGNHDVPVYNPVARFFAPWSRFRRIVAAEIEPVLAVGDIRIFGLNSARRAGPSLDWSLGRLSRRQIRSTAQALATAPKDALKVVAFHHPVRAAAGRAGAAVIPEASAALEAFAGAGADIVLTGHSHIASADLEETPRGAIVVAAAGTAASTRLRGERVSFNSIHWNADALEVLVHRYGEDRFSIESQKAFRRGPRGWLVDDRIETACLD